MALRAVSRLLLHWLAFSSVAALPHQSQLDGDDYVVDLGYAKHAPTFTNTTINGMELLNYNNIRYAQPPLGDKRFRKPAVPPPPSEGIQVGNMSSWETDCVSSATPGNPFPLLNGTTWGSEDCLLLNVIKPADAKEGDNLPVVHWVVGSAFAFGGKDWTGFGVNTHGLFNAPLGASDRFIIVTHNYRLGVPGWTPQFDEGMNGNLGVWDTLAALEWTKQHISKFGGDPDNITAIGQSAGAVIITWLLLAENGTVKLPFDQAWIASPTVAPRRNMGRHRPIWDDILNATTCDGVACLRGLSEAAMTEVNKHMLIEQPPGPGGGSLGPAPGFTPTVDGELLSDLPANLLASGKINKGIKSLVVGNTAGEGLMASASDMPARFPVIVHANIPNASDEDIAALMELYPYPPELPEQLAYDYTNDIVWTCNSLNVAAAYNSNSRMQLFSVPPAFHGQDLWYYFYDPRTLPLPTDYDVQLAKAAGAMLLQFMFRRDFELPDVPYAEKLSEWPVYAEGGVWANMTLEEGYGVAAVPDFQRKRCDLINSLIKDPSKGV